MSTPFYDLASMVVLPSGYKSGKIYAQKPLTTDGQLTFTRASTATRVNASGLIESVASGVPRLDYTNSTCPKILLEPQRSNVVIQSEDIGGTAWQLYFGTRTANTTETLDPAGTNTAEKIVMGSGNQTVIRQSIGGLTNGATYTFSLYIKQGSGVTGFLDISDNSAAVDITPTSQWVRYTKTGVWSTTNNFVDIEFRGTSGSAYCYIWGAQLEAGAYATSYIPTLGTSVTRVADAASKTGISSLLSASEYTLFWEGTHIPTSQYNSFMTVYNAANNNLSARFYRNNTNNEVRAAIFNPSTGLSLDLGSGITTQTAKCALRVKSGSYALYVNGTLAASSTSSLAPASTLDSVTLQYFDDTQSFDQKTAQVLFFKTGLTNAQLAELTTL